MVILLQENVLEVVDGGAMNIVTVMTVFSVRNDLKVFYFDSFHFVKPIYFSWANVFILYLNWPIIMIIVVMIMVWMLSIVVLVTLEIFDQSYHLKICIYGYL